MAKWEIFFRREREAGQALVELLVLSPLLFLLVLGGFQLALTCEADLLVHMAVRQAAEMYLQGASLTEISRNVKDYLSQYAFIDVEKVRVNVKESLLTSRVDVAYEVPVISYLRGTFPPPTVGASMTVAREIFDMSRFSFTRTLCGLFRYLSYKR